MEKEKHRNKVFYKEGIKVRRCIKIIAILFSIGFFFLPKDSYALYKKE